MGMENQIREFKKAYRELQEAKDYLRMKRAEYNKIRNSILNGNGE